MTHTVTWDEIAKLILRARGAEGAKVKLIFIKDGKVNIETE